MIDSQSPRLSTPQLPKRVAGFLASGRAVFFWRQGNWHMKPDSGARTVRLARRTGLGMDAVARSGKLVEGPPGFYRGSGGRAALLLNDAESPLSRLAALRDKAGRPVVDPEQVAAGERLRRDFEASGLSPRVTISYDPASGQGGRHWQTSDNHIARLAETAIAARQRMHEAFDAVGPELSGILYHVCCLAGGLESAEQHLALPRRSGKAILLLALTRLARHYGFKPRMSHGGPAAIGHWSLPGSRPEISPPEPRQP